MVTYLSLTKQILQFLFLLLQQIQLQHPFQVLQKIKLCLSFLLVSFERMWALLVEFKRDKKNSSMPVEKAMDHTNIMTVNNMQTSAQRQWSYMLGYLRLKVLSTSTWVCTKMVGTLPNMLCSLMEWVVKMLKKRQKSNRNY